MGLGRRRGSGGRRQQQQQQYSTTLLVVACLCGGWPVVGVEPVGRDIACHTPYHHPRHHLSSKEDSKHSAVSLLLTASFN